MRHIKTFKSINEDKLGDCDFETFKEIMYEISDDFNNVDFNDYSEDYFYDCWIDLSDTLTYDDFNLSFDYLSEVVEPYDSPDNIKYILQDNTIHGHIESYIDGLYKLKSGIDSFIEDNKKVSKLFKDIEEFILPRFQSFDNFVQCDVGIDTIGRIRVTFEMEERIR